MSEKAVYFNWTPWVTVPRLLNPGSSTFVPDQFHFGFTKIYRKNLSGDLESRTFRSMKRAQAWAIGQDVPENPEDTPEERRFSISQAEHYIKHGSTDIENYPDFLTV